MSKEISKKAISNVFEVILIIIVLIVLFSLVSLKYYQTQKTEIFDTIGIFPEDPIINGYKVSKIVNRKELETKASLIPNNNSELEYTRTVPILVYHGITPVENELDTTYEEFKNQMFLLKENGYTTITIEDFYLYLKGEKQVPKKSIIITFDDGRKNSYYYSKDVLEVLNYTAVMFVISKYSIEQDHIYYLNKRELHKMEESNMWELGSHSYDGHGRIQINPESDVDSFFGNKMWIESLDRYETEEEYELRVSTDLNLGKSTMEKEFNHTIDFFAIPFSDFGQYKSNFPVAQEINQKIYKSLFKVVFYQYKPIKNKDFKANYNDKNEEFYFATRITVNPGTTPKALYDEIEASMEVELPYIENFENKNKWISNWGDIIITNNSLIINTTEYSVRSTLIYLDGSYLLEDYEYSLVLLNNSNQKIGLMVRFQNIEDYTMCVYGDNYVTLEIIENGNLIFNKKVKLPSDYNLEEKTELKVKVQGNNVDCIIGNLTVISTPLENITKYGGVGLKTWSLDNLDQKKFGYSEITEIKINALE